MYNGVHQFCVDLRFSMKSFHVLWKTRAILGVCFFSYVQWRASVLRRFYFLAGSEVSIFILHEVIPRLWLYCAIFNGCFFSYVQWRASVLRRLRFWVGSEVSIFQFGPAEVPFWAHPRFWQLPSSDLAAFSLILLAPCTPFRAGHHRCPEFAGLWLRGRQLWSRGLDFGVISG